MDHETSLTHHVSAAPDAVWAVISDIPGSAATLSSIEAVRMLTDGPYAAGTRWEETRKMLGRRETIEMWVADADPPAPGQGGRTTVQAQSGGADYTTRFVLTPRDSGTDVTVTFGADMANPSRLNKVMMAVLGPVGMRITRKALAKDLAEIAAKAESL